MKNHGITARVAAKRDQSGDKNSSWRGDEATYAAYHKRVEAARGKPNRCERCGTKRKCEWANLTGDYADVNDYERICRSCHRKMDNQRRAETGLLTSTHVPRRAGRK